jgi:hypothetical protein
MQEASHAGMPTQLRALLVEMLLCCEIAAPHDLLALVEDALMEDHAASVHAQLEGTAGKQWAHRVASGAIIDRGDHTDNSSDTSDTEDEVGNDVGRRVRVQPDALAAQAPRVLMLLDLERLLARHGRTLADTGLPAPMNAQRLMVHGLLPRHLQDAGTNVLARSLAKDPVEQAATYAALAADLSTQQRAVVDNVFDMVAAGNGGIVFLTAEGGCGKTHTLRAIGTRVGGCQCAPGTADAPAPPCRACAAARGTTNPDAEDEDGPDQPPLEQSPEEEAAARRESLAMRELLANATAAMDTDGGSDADGDEAAPPPAVGGTEAAVRGTGISRYTYQAVASSGIAAQVLGLEATTAHGAFKIPIAVDLQRVPRCNIQGAAMRDHAAVLRDLDMIIWDEVSMQHRKAVEAVDRSLRDLMEDAAVAQYRKNTGGTTPTDGLDNTAGDWGDAWRLRQKALLPFGGKVVVFSGHWKQCLPIVHRGSKPSIKKACIFNCSWWQNVTVHAQRQPRVTLLYIQRYLNHQRLTGVHAHGELSPPRLGHAGRHGGARGVGGVPVQARRGRHDAGAAARRRAGRTGVRANRRAGGRLTARSMGRPAHNNSGGGTSADEDAHRQRECDGRTLRSPADAAPGAGRGGALCVPRAGDTGGCRHEPRGDGQDTHNGRGGRTERRPRGRDNGGRGGQRGSSGRGGGERCGDGRDRCGRAILSAAVASRAEAQDGVLAEQLHDDPVSRRGDRGAVDRHAARCRGARHGRRAGRRATGRNEPRRRVAPGGGPRGVPEPTHTVRGRPPPAVPENRDATDLHTQPAGLRAR